jgi:hypothetical protein
MVRVKNTVAAPRAVTPQVNNVAIKAIQTGLQPINQASIAAMRFGYSNQKFRQI